MQSIAIKNLGPIQAFEMDIKKINILIGEQATGKSTISKAIYFFRMIKSEITTYLFQLATIGKYHNKKDVFPKALNTPLKEIFVALFGYTWELDEKLDLKFNFTPKIFIELDLLYTQKFISLTYSDTLTTEIKLLEKQMKDIYKRHNEQYTNFSFMDAERLRLHEEIMASVNALFHDDLETYYIPAGRSLLTLMANQKTKLDYTSMDLVNRKFMQFIENIQPEFASGIQNVHKRYDVGEKFNAKEMASDIVQKIKGDYQYTNNGEYFLIGSEKNKIKINFTSSGQQEVLWLLNQLYVLMLRKERAFVIIEEPEAHLYPTLQKEVLEFIAQFANINDSSVCVTTHSPYILTVANALYFAGKLYQHHPEQRAKIDQIVGKQTHFSPSDFGAYKLKASAMKLSAEDMIDPELQEIKTELIDDVSDQINEVYTELFYLEGENADS